ncbi:sulfurtransferase TusA family protein [Clostridium butyricum]
MSKMIDAKGKNCPMPVIMAKKEIDAGAQELIIEVDNSIAVENLKKLANSQGFLQM